MVWMEQSRFSEEQKANYRGAKYGSRKFFGGLETVLAGWGVGPPIKGVGA